MDIEPSPPSPVPNCARCGLLTRYVAVGPFPEIRQDTRDAGGDPTDRLGYFVCHVGKAELQQEMPNAKIDERAVLSSVGGGLQGFENAGRWQTVFKRERPECIEEFVEYRPDVSPKEHAEMLDRRKMLDWQDVQKKEHRAWEQRESQLNRALQERLVTNSDNIQLEAVRATRTASKWQLWGAVIAARSLVLAITIAVCGTDNGSSSQPPTPNTATSQP